MDLENIFGDNIFISFAETIQTCLQSLTDFFNSLDKFFPSAILDMALVIVLGLLVMRILHGASGGSGNG